MLLFKNLKNLLSVRLYDVGTNLNASISNFSNEFNQKLANSSQLLSAQSAKFINDRDSNSNLINQIQTNLNNQVQLQNGNHSNILNLIDQQSQNGADNVQDITTQLDESNIAENDRLQTGTIIEFCSESNIPSNFLLCDGSPKFISDYPALFNVVGNPLPDNQRFALPDFNSANKYCVSAACECSIGCPDPFWPSWAPIFGFINKHNVQEVVLYYNGNDNGAILQINFIRPMVNMDYTTTIQTYSYDSSNIIHDNKYTYISLGYLNTTSSFFFNICPLFDQTDRSTITFVIQVTESINNNPKMIKI